MDHQGIPTLSLFFSFTLSFSISFLFLSHVKIQGDPYKPENDHSPQSQNTCILILDFQPLKLCKINICRVTLPIYDILFSSAVQSCPPLCDPMNRSTPGLPVHHHLLEFPQTHVHGVSDAIQPSHPLLSPFPLAPNPSQHQSFPMSQLFA